MPHTVRAVGEVWEQEDWEMKMLTGWLYSSNLICSLSGTQSLRYPVLRLALSHVASGELTSSRVEPESRDW